MVQDILNAAGALRAAEFVLSLVSWACVVSWSPYNTDGALVYGVTVLIIFWLLDLAWLVIFGAGLKDRINLDAASWGAVNFGLSVAGALLLFVASCCLAAGSNGVTVVQVGTAFCFFTTGVWIVSCLFAWREMKGSFCWGN